MDHRNYYSLLELKDVFIAAPCGVCIFDSATGQPLFLNEIYYRITGYTPEEYDQLIGEQYKRLIFPPDLAEYESNMQGFIQGGRLKRSEYRAVRKNGDIYWVKLSVVHISVDGRENILCFIGDITAEKENFTNLELALEQHRYQTVIDEMKAAVFEWNLSTGEFYCSENYSEYEMSKVPPEQILANVGPMDTIHPDDIPNMLQFFEDTRSGKHRAEVTVRMKLAAGGYRWCRLVGIFYKDEQGTPSRTIGVVIDISEEKEKSFILDSLLNQLPGGVAVFKMSKPLECLYFNDGFAKLTGRTNKQLWQLLKSENYLETLVAPPDLLRFRREARELVDSGSRVNITYRFLTETGEHQWAHMNASKLREEDGYPVYYCVFTVPSDEATIYRNVVEDSADGVVVAEQKTRRIIYCNRAMREMYNIPLDIPLIGRRIQDFIPNGSIPLSRAEIEKLPKDSYISFYRQNHERYLAFRAKALTWNGVDCYILYVSDETQEHQKHLQQQELLNLVPVGIGIYEIVGGKISQVYMNDGYYRMIGDTRKHRNENSRGDFMEFSHPDDEEKIISTVKSFVKGSSEEVIDHRIRCGDGEYRWFRLVASVAARDGEHIKLYCSYANINDAIVNQEMLKNLNHEIQKQYSLEILQRKLLENDSMVVVQFNVTQDKLVTYRVNNDLFGEYKTGTAGSLIRTGIPDRIPTEKERLIAADFFNREKALERFQNGTKEFSAEYRRRLSNGRLCWVRATCRLARDEESGDIISYTFTRDIDIERKKDLTAESVIDEETDFVMLLNVISSTAMLLHQRNCCKNNGWKLYDEFPFDKAPDMGELDIVEAEDRQAVGAFFHMEELAERLRNESVVNIIYRHRYPDGTVRRKKARAFFLDEIKEDIVVVRRDITDIYQEEQEQKQLLQHALEEAKSAGKAKGDFLSRMSHDLRTPMNVIIGLTAIAMDSANQTPEMQETLSNITSSAKYLLSLINDCLDLEKINSGKIELHPRPCFYEEFCKDIYNMIGPLCREKNISFTIEDDKQNYPPILADKTRMEQIFYNLLSNAVKFTPEGGTIQFHTMNSHIKDGMVSFTHIVRDNGVGMSEEFQCRMFEAFAQEQNSITSEGHGTGLGLSIVKQLADLMGTEISAKSKLGEGTEFRLDFCLPLAEEQAKEEKEKILKNPDFLQGKRVILAEDHPLNSIIAVKLLQKQGILVTAVENGQIALDEFLAHPAHYFDAVLMDIHMPVMNGLESAMAIRSSAHTDAKTIPIIAITANAFDADEQDSLRAGMNAHLSKPIEPQKLYETLMEYITHGER